MVKAVHRASARSVKLRQNPHNVHEWLQRAKLYKDDVLIALWVGDREWSTPQWSG